MNSFSWPLLRDAGRLLLLQNQPLPTVGKRLRCRGVDSAWRLQRFDLEQLPETADNASLKPVREAWARLGRASHDAETLAALLLVLCASGCAGGRCTLPLPPLKSRDVRPWLGDAEAVVALLRALSQFITPALQKLSRYQGLPVDELRDRGGNLEALDLFVLTRCGEAICAADAAEALPLGRELLVLSPSGRRWVEAGLAARAIQSLHLDEAEDGMGLAARVWALSGSGWLRETAVLERGEHATMLRLLVETGCASKAPPKDVRYLLETLRHIGRPERRGPDLQWVVKGLQRGASAGHLASALRFAHKCLDGNVVKLCEAPKGRQTVSSHLFIWLEKTTSKYWTKRAWRACADNAVLQEGIRQIRTVRIVSWAISDLLRILIRLHKRSEDCAPLAEEDLKRLTNVILNRVRHLGPNKGATWVDALLCLVGGSYPVTAAGFDQAIQLNDRFHRLSGEEARSIGFVLGAMMGRKGEEMLRLASALDDNWCNRIAEASGTWVRRESVCDGIRRLRSRALDMLWPACRLLPLQWFSVMQEIACVPIGRLKPLFESAEEHPLFACRLRVDDPSMALVMIDAVREERCKTNPVTSRLREHAAGKRRLPTHLLEHDLAQIHRGWLEAQLHLIRELVQREIWRAFPGLKPEHGITEHSLRVALTIDSNERPLRRLIRECARGEPGWTERHPLNRQWDKRLGEQRAERWRDGIATVRVLPQHGEVIIAPENDPQEVLRMGSVAGSCLSAGAINSFAAAANALDANKRVVYARNRSGKIVGRQLLAISEEKRLVCFRPYPEQMHGALEGFFADYDEVLAFYLGLPLNHSCDYTIKTLVAKEWYDDGIWDRMVRIE